VVLLKLKFSSHKIELSIIKPLQRSFDLRFLQMRYLDVRIRLVSLLDEQELLIPTGREIGLKMVLVN
jgi:hypothetical protein